MSDDASTDIASAETRRMPGPLRAILVLGLLYLFLVGVKLLESGVKGLGEDFSQTLFEGVSNPLLGLFVGILATVMVQSSSVSTSFIVGLVATGTLSVENAVPMIMGANIGTTVTNTIVSLAHLRRSEEFRRAFTAATMHDFFNLIVVAVLLPVQVFTKVLSNMAESITDLIAGGEQLGGSFSSPIKGVVKWGASRFQDVLEVFASDTEVVGTLSLILGIGLIFLALAFVTKNMRVLVADRIERSLNAALARSGLVGMVVGMIVTISVQSSSITTSILIPLVASGILVVRNAYPITLGANVGTTVTALLAALGSGEINGLTIAVAHTLFNVIGIAMVYSVPKIRYVPVVLAERLAGIAVERRWLAITYTTVMFILVPALGIVILR